MDRKEGALVPGGLLIRKAVSNAEYVRNSFFSNLSFGEFVHV